MQYELGKVYEYAPGELIYVSQKNLVRYEAAMSFQTDSSSAIEFSRWAIKQDNIRTVLMPMEKAEFRLLGIHFSRQHLADLFLLLSVLPVSLSPYLHRDPMKRLLSTFYALVSEIHGTYQNRRFIFRYLPNSFGSA